MHAVRGKVIDGQVVVQEELPEGASVTVVIEDEPAVELSSQDAAEIELRSMAVDRGEYHEYESIDEFMDKLRDRRHEASPIRGTR